MPSKQRRQSPSRSSFFQGAAALVIVGLAIGLGLVVTSGGDDDGPDFGETALTAAAKPLADGLQLVVPALEKWRNEPGDNSTVLSAIDTFLTRAEPVAADLAAVPAASELRQAKKAAVVSIRLYTVYGELSRVAVRLPVGDLQTQVDLIARRVRVVADRIYDRVVLTLNDDAFDTGPDVEMRRPPDVPDWVTEGQGAGPPLDEPPPAPADEPPIREEGRKEQVEDDWLDEVAQAVTVPSSAVALNLDDGEELRDLARELARIAVDLGDVDDPPGGRERAALVRLGLLLQAEAARTGQAALAVSSPELREELQGLARRLLLAGDVLWDPELPSRRSGLDPELLETA